jgi:hypothetical protein
MSTVDAPETCIRCGKPVADDEASYLPSAVAVDEPFAGPYLEEHRAWVPIHSSWRRCRRTISTEAELNVVLDEAIERAMFLGPARGDTEAAKAALAA